MESNNTRPKGRPKIRWEDDTVNDLKVTKVNNGQDVYQIGKYGRKTVQKAEKFNEMKFQCIIKMMKNKNAI